LTDDGRAFQARADVTGKALLDFDYRTIGLMDERTRVRVRVRGQI